MGVVGAVSLVVSVCFVDFFGLAAIVFLVAVMGNNGLNGLLYGFVIS